MLEGKLWHNSIYIKQKYKGYKDGGKPHRFNFGNFFNSITLSLLPFLPSAEEKISSENAVREEWVISTNVFVK